MNGNLPEPLQQAALAAALGGDTFDRAASMEPALAAALQQNPQPRHKRLKLRQWPQCRARRRRYRLPHRSTE